VRVQFLAPVMLVLAGACVSTDPSTMTIAACEVEFVILGIGQDGGAPQIDNHDDPAWDDPSRQLLAASGALIDHRSGSRYLFEATPDIREQLFLLEDIAGPANDDLPMGLSGVFLTHAHIGHYAGLMFAGHESAGTKRLPVYTMPRMAEYLSSNGPWDQLVRYENIRLSPLNDAREEPISNDISVTPYKVPHRDEYSETVGYVINGPSQSVLFLPDIDDWDQWESEYGHRINDMVAKVNVAYLDATFFDDNELPGRDMSAIPHPRIAETMDRFEHTQRIEQEKIRFFHLNHTNAARFETSPATIEIQRRGFRVAKRGESVCLD
jgi:pyrroloquinoline quinone biosynthesis protein B